MDKALWKLLNVVLTLLWTRPNLLTQNRINQIDTMGSHISDKEILKIKNLCRKNNKKFFISNNIRLASQLDLDGVYIPSFNKELKINCFSKKKKFAIIGSAEKCINKLMAIKQLGIERIFVIGPRPDHFGQEADDALARFAKEVIPALKK